MYAFRKAKGSAAYNQIANTNLISIIKYGRLLTKYGVFLDEKRILAGDQSECPNLLDSSLSESGGLSVSECDSLELLYAETCRWRCNLDSCAAHYQG